MEYKAEAQLENINENVEQRLETKHIKNNKIHLPTTEKKKHSFDCKASPLDVDETGYYRMDPLDAFENECSEIKKDKSDHQSDFDRSDVLKQRVTTAFCRNHDTPFKQLLASAEMIPGLSHEHASDGTSEVCSFCTGEAQFICEFCTFFYCKNCLEKLHPALGPYLSHKVIQTGIRDRTEQYSQCKEHGLVAQMFCSYCEQNRCFECVKSKCTLHFKGRVSDADIEKEKTKLVEELDRATTKFGFLESYKEKFQHKIANIQMTGLLRREQIRHEFVSFYDLLIQEEAKMLEQLDQEVNERVDHVLGTLQDSVKCLEMEDANLTTTVTELVQTPNDAWFIQEYVKAKDLCNQVDDKVRDFNRDWARSSIYTPCPVLDNHFTMLLEKKQLAEKLNGALEHLKLCFKQSTLFMKRQQLDICDYMEPPVLPPSTKVLYHMQLLQRGKLVYELKTRDLQDLKLNHKTTYILRSGVSYLLKVTPVYSGLSNSIMCVDQDSRQGSPCHMFLVVLD